VGIGMVLCVVMLSFMQSSAEAHSAMSTLARQWALLGMASCLLATLPMYFLVAPAKRQDRERKRSATQRTDLHAIKTKFIPSAALRRLITSYGLLGFGYIISATFIVAMARKINTPGLESWTWITVGLAGTPSVFLWQKVAQKFGVMSAMRWSYMTLIVGVLCAGVAKSIPMVIIGAMLLGGTFMAITSMGIQVARDLGGAHSGLAMGWMTVAFGLGQLLGPAVAGRMAQGDGDFFRPSLLAATLLMISVWLSRREQALPTTRS
jgi:predicted MFS family arabinose efflux permease